MRRSRRLSAVSPGIVDPLPSTTTLRGIRSARGGLGQRRFRSSALHGKSYHASVSVMLEKHGGRCRTDGTIRVVSCQMRHDSRNQGRVVSLSMLRLLSACVRLCQLREIHHSLQQVLNPWSRTQSAATDGSPACCTSPLMLRVCVMLRWYPLITPCVHCLCRCCTNSGACPVWPILFGALYAVADAFCLEQMLGAY